MRLFGFFGLNEKPPFVFDILQPIGIPPFTFFGAVILFKNSVFNFLANILASLSSFFSYLSANCCFKLPKCHAPLGAALKDPES